VYWREANSSSANVGRDVTCAPSLDRQTAWVADIKPVDIDAYVGVSYVGATCVGVGRTISIPLDNGCPASINVGLVTPNWLSSRTEPSTGLFMPIGTDDFDWCLDMGTVAGS